MRQAKSRKFSFQQLGRFHPIHQARVDREPEFGMKAAQQVKAERVESPDPHRGRRIAVAPRDAVRHLAGSLVREGQQKDPAWVDAVGEQSLHATDQRPRLARPRPGFQQEGDAAVRCGVGLPRRERLVDVRWLEAPLGGFAARLVGRRFRQQQRVEQLLGDNVERRVESRGDGRRGKPVLEVQRANYRAREQELPREEIHLHFAALPPPVVQHAVHADGRRLRRARRVDVEWTTGVGRALVTGLNQRVAQRRMTKLVGDEERPVEGGADVLVNDQVVARDIGCAPPVQHRCPDGRCLNVEVLAQRLRQRKRVRVSRVLAASDGRGVQGSGGLAGDFNAIHSPWMPRGKSSW